MDTERTLTRLRLAAAAILVAQTMTVAGATASPATTAPATTATAAPSAGEPEGRAAAPPYVTLLFSRSQWSSALDCTPLAGVVPLDIVAAELQRRGMAGTGTVVTQRTGATGRCPSADSGAGRSILYGSWADLARLRTTYGWTFVSHSRTYRDLTRLSAAEQRNESCGSLDDLLAHGHTRGDGLFAYPNNRHTDVIQRNVVASCFAFGRRYDMGLNRRASTGPPWFQRTGSINGGNCNIVSLPCYDFTAPRRYAPPARPGDQLAALKPDDWFVMQNYRFVTGAVAGRWDCRDADWQRHWTSRTEEYCWNDYLSILDRIPTSAVVTDPKTVAQAWGRTVP